MKYFCFIYFLIIPFHFFGQEYETLPPQYIKTIEFTNENDLPGTPIIQLGERLKLTFDDTRALVEDFYYVIEHYNYDWTPSKLAKNEYITGFDNIRIFNFKNSLTTLQPFTHYELNIPNKNLRGLKVTGNYMLKIFNSDKQLVFSRKFMVYDNLVDVKTQIRRSRNLDYIGEKQLVEYTVGRSGFIFRNPEETVNTVVIQNNDLMSAVHDVKPLMISGNNLVFNYPKKTAFWGGNEFLFFDNRDIRVATLNIARVELEELYHTYLRTNIVRDERAYVFNPDINGSFRINTVQGSDENREADYAKVHFSLICNKELNDGELHVYGRFNNYSLTDETHLKYNKNTGLYETEILLKQGFYNYKYVYLTKEGNFNDHFVSGSHDITENDYVVLVYYKDVGARYDALIGVGSANSRNIIN